MNLKKSFIGFLAVALIAGCSKDDEQSEPSFSILPIEQHKENLENGGLNVIDKLSGLSELKTIPVLQDFIDLTSNDDPFDNDPAGNVMGILKPIETLKEGADAPFKLKSSSPEFESFSQLFNDEQGIYTFNEETQLWNKEEKEGEITFHFVTGKSNQEATISFTNFTYITTTNEEVSDLTEDLPQSVDVSLMLEGQKLAEIEFRATYDRDNLPASFSETFRIDDYVIASTLSRSNSKIAFDQSFKYMNEEIMSSHFESEGIFDYDNLSENQDDIKFFEQTVVNSIKVWMTMDNYKIEGTIDCKTINEKADQYQIDEESSSKQAKERMAQMLNNNVKLDILYVKENQFIAVSDFFAYSYDDDKDWDIDMRMVFEDGSSMDDSFFDIGFENLVEEATDLRDSASDNYKRVK